MFRSDHEQSSTQLRQSYEKLYDQGWLGERQSLFVWLMKYLRLQPNERLLDVACGDAQLATWVEREGGVYYGTDFANHALQRSSCQRLVLADGQALPFAPHCFHWVTCIGSLEHFQDIELGMREIARVMRSDGRAVLILPNAFGLTWNLLSVWRNGQISDDDGQPQQGFATRVAWEQLLRKNGLAVSSVVGYERAWPRTRHAWAHYWRQPLEVLLALLWPIVPLNLRRSFLFCCQRAK
jgi:SAM-dependent methyltransferase